MQFVAKSRYVRYSPYKLRPLADVIRGKKVRFALALLSTSALKKADPLKKMIESAAANAKNLKNIDIDALAIKEIRIDQGPIYKYYKPGAMGRANPQKKRLSHMNVILESIEKKEA
jgi:large subunit ribosomal protein L22